MVVVVETGAAEVVGAGGSGAFAEAGPLSSPPPEGAAVASGDPATVTSATVVPTDAPDEAGSPVSVRQAAARAHSTNKRPTVAGRRRTGGMIMEPSSLASVQPFLG